MHSRTLTSDQSRDTTSEESVITSLYFARGTRPQITKVTRSILLAIPLDGALQAFLEAHAGRVAEMLSRKGKVRQRVLPVARALGFVLHLSPESDEFLEHLKGFVQVDSCACCHIEHPPGYVIRWSLAGEQVRLHHVFYESKVTALLAITENCRLFI